MTGILIVTGAGVWLASHRVSWRRRPAVAQPCDVGVVARLVLVGLTSGLTLGGALEAAARELGGPTLRLLDDVLRRSRVVGLAAAIADDDSPYRRFLQRLARAHLTGARLDGTVLAFIEEHRAGERATTLERLRRLPVTLTVPLALLILPGFVLLTLGPTVASVVQELLGRLL